MTPKRPRDVNELAKQLVDEATGEHTLEPVSDGKDPAAVELGRKGGLKGREARAAKLSPERRRFGIVSVTEVREFLEPLPPVEATLTSGAGAFYFAQR
jgi:hypothetical protein